MYAIIVGSGKVGVFLSQALLEHGHEVLLIEDNPDKYELLFQKLGDLVVLGDGTDTEILRRMGIERADVVVALTGEDEDNLAVSLAAKSLGVTRVISRVNNPRNEEIFKLMGIHRTISSTRRIFNMIEQEVEMSAVLPFLALHHGEVEAIKLEVVPSSPLVGQKVGSIGLPEKAVAAGVVRADRLLPARPDMPIEAGDWLLVIAPSDVVPELERCFRLNECR